MTAGPGPPREQEREGFDKGFAAESGSVEVVRRRRASIPTRCNPESFCCWFWSISLEPEVG